MSAISVLGHSDLLPAIESDLQRTATVTTTTHPPLPLGTAHKRILVPYFGSKDDQLAVILGMQMAARSADHLVHVMLCTPSARFGSTTEDSSAFFEFLKGVMARGCEGLVAGQVIVSDVVTAAPLQALVTAVDATGPSLDMGHIGQGNHQTYIHHGCFLLF